MVGNIFPAGPSWPFRTQSAITTWKRASKILEKDPSTLVSSALQQAMLDEDIPASELTPEDMQILAMAARWKIYTLTNGKEQSSKYRW